MQLALHKTTMQSTVCVWEDFFVHHPHRSFHSHRNEMASKGREGGSIRDDSPLFVTQLTHYSSVGGCHASGGDVAWSRDSWDNCAQCQPGDSSTFHIRQWLVYTTLSITSWVSTCHCTPGMCQSWCGYGRYLQALLIQSESSKKWLQCPISLQCYKLDCSLWERPKCWTSMTYPDTKVEKRWFV